jgi:hypothetical protein
LSTADAVPLRGDFVGYVSRLVVVDAHETVLEAFVVLASSI